MIELRPATTVELGRAARTIEIGSYIAARGGTVGHAEEGDEIAGIAYERMLEGDRVVVDTTNGHATVQR